MHLHLGENVVKATTTKECLPTVGEHASRLHVHQARQHLEQLVSVIHIHATTATCVIYMVDIFAYDARR